MRKLALLLLVVPCCGAAAPQAPPVPMSSGSYSIKLHPRAGGKAAGKEVEKIADVLVESIVVTMLTGMIVVVALGVIRGSGTYDDIKAPDREPPSKTKTTKYS